MGGRGKERDVRWRIVERGIDSAKSHMIDGGNLYRERGSLYSEKVAVVKVEWFSNLALLGI
jgi:hypothetical protein